MDMNRSGQKRNKDNQEAVALRGRIDRFFSRWERFRGYTALMMALIFFAVYLTARTYHQGTDAAAQLKFVDSASEQPADLRPSGFGPPKQILSGEAYDTALRLRESGALLMAVSLSSFETFRISGRFPSTAIEVFSDLQKRSLLPPGIEIRAGAVRSPSSELTLNYRPEPFSFEIVSVPTSGNVGPAILFRFPSPPGEANSIMYFQSTPGRTPIITSQFGTPEQLSAAGWSIRHWRGEALPLDDSTLRDLQEQDAWSKSLNRGIK